MKAVIKYSLAASMVASSAASAHNHHQHQHLHKKHEGSPVEKREPDVVTQYVSGPTETVWELAGELLDAEKAQDGIDNGKFVVVGESTPTYTPPPQPTTTSVAANMGAQFLEKSSSTSTKPTTTSTPTPSTTSTPPPPASTSQSAPTGGQGVDSEFPSGEIKCSHFPSDYGAVPLDWLGTSGWASLQYVPNFSLGELSISDIIGGVLGDDCTPNSFCSYACPPGYQKTQWPDAQGSTGQSIGGLYCNNDGYLELVREGYKTLCEEGMGGVTIQNDLSDHVATCRTDYPASEAMVIPAVAEAGGSVVLTNPDQNKYYQWEGKPTSAQYYVNPAGCTKEDCCVWKSSQDSGARGNWAAANLGVGYASDGNTYLSVFHNDPTSSAPLDFNIEISGDVTVKCVLEKGSTSGGCTTGMRKGGQAVIRYY